MDAKPLYEDFSFGNDKVLTERYIAKLINQIVTGEVARLECIDRGELVEYMEIRKIAILFHIAPENDFRSDAFSIRKRIARMLDKHPRCEFVVRFYKDTEGLFQLLDENK